MKVDSSKLKKSSSELTPECRQLIEQITKCHTRAELLQFLESVHIWIYGKCELYHWIDILDRFDNVLEESARPLESNEYKLYCDTRMQAEDKRLLLLVLNFTTLLIEHSFSRHLYNSIEHLTQLLSSENMDIVLAVLNLLYMFSKRSNFIPRLSFEKKEMLLLKLFNIAERWGDPNYGLALIDCCMRKPKLEFLYQLFVEYLDENGQMTLLEIPDMMDMCNRSSPTVVTKTIIDQMSNPSDAVKMRIAHRVRLVSGFKNDKLRLQFVQARLQAVSVLIYSNALSDNTDKVLYPGFGEELCELIDKEDVHLVEIRAAVLRTLTSMLHFDRNPNVLRPGSRLPKIIQYTGAERQSGTLPLLVRDCIANLTGNGISEKYPLILATSLFSLLYHLASYEIGGHALVKSGMMQSLLRVISWPGMDLEHITFVTRAVRVIDLITNIDIAKFHQNNGLNVFIDRLEKEINSCRKALDEKRTGEGNIETEETKFNEDREENTAVHVQRNAITVAQHQANNDEIMRADDEQVPERPILLQSHQNRRHSADSDVVILDDGNLDSPSYSPNSDLASGLPPTSPNSQGESSNNATSATNPEESRDADLDGDQIQYPANSYYSRPFNERNAEYNQMLLTEVAKRPACVTQRAALLKSMLNFLKKSIQDHSHFNGMRNIMETSLPNSLRHIISNAEYYGPSLFLLATDVVTVYVFNEPSLLSSLQDFGLTSIILQSLLRKDVPATREVLGSLPNVFSALCLNERGLMEFMSYEPFDKLLKVLLSPDYLVAMRRRRSSDPLGDTATNLGNAMDDLMKHHPYLRTDATEAIVRLLNELVRLGSDINFVCWRANKDSQSSTGNNNSSPAGVDQAHITNPGAADDVATAGNVETAPATETDHDSSGEDDDDDDEMSSASQQQAAAQQQHRQNRDTSSTQPSRNPILEREAIPLIDYILNVMKFIEAIFSNSSNGEHCHEFVLHGGLKPLLQLLSLPNLPVDSPVSTTAQAVANVCKSILNLAHETKVIDTALQQLSQIVSKLKPLIRNFSFPGGSVLLCELLSCPRPEDGFSIADFTPLLHSMSSVHGYVVMLVCLCRNASNEMRSMLLTRWGAKNETGLYLLQNLVQLYISLVWESTILLSLCSDEPYTQNSADLNWEEMSALLPMIKEVQRDINAMDTSNVITEGGEQKFERSSSAFKAKLKPEDQLRYIKSLLAASSRLGRALAELFGTLVKLSVGTPQTRQRRNNEYVPTMGASSKAPSADAKEIARVLSSILVNGFTHENIVPKPAPKLKLTFLICSVGFTGPMLFDDKRSAFHLMISQFCAENGLKAYFDMFYWALSLKNPPSKFSYEQSIKMENILEDCEDDELDLPDGTSEFLDAWLQLLEKMVNPRAILDSPYAISSAPNSTVQFEPVFYMLHIHQLALHAIRRIWKRKPLANYAVSMTETMMAIIKHLVKSHSVLRVQSNQRLEEIANAEKKKEKEAAEHAVDVDKEYFKLLVDMGFAAGDVVFALHLTRTLEEATDYLLNPPSFRTSTPLLNGIGANVFDTIAENTDSASSNAMEVEVMPTAESSSSHNADAIPGTSAGLTNNSNLNNVIKMDYAKLTVIPEKTFAEFCKQALERTFCFMENLPEPIFSVGTELIYVLYRRHSIAERHLFVLNLARDLGDLTEQMIQALPTEPFSYTEFEKIDNGEFATKLYIRLKVSTILLEETYADMRKDYCTELVHEQTLASLITLLMKTVGILDEQANSGQCLQPRWLQVLIEFIDALDNVCTILQRKANMRAVCSDNWKWYDSSTGKWNAYSEANNTIIKNAFNMGERSVNFNIGRQRYSINFNCMKQVSEASGSHRPVLPSLKINEAIHNYANGNPHFRAEKILTRTIKTRPDGLGIVQHDELLCLNSLLNITPPNNSNNNHTTTTQMSEDPKSNVSANINTTTAATPITTQTSECNSNVEVSTTPPLPQSTALTTTVAAEEATETNSTTANSTEIPETSTAANATAQADDLSMSNASKKTKNKANSSSKTSVLPKRLLMPVERVKRVILREENVGLAKFNTEEIVACLVRILRPTLRIDFETKLSVLKLCARLTKDYKNARAFYNNFGISRLLNMRQSCGFMGFPTFAIVIIRHMLEPPPVLQDAIERILSMRTWPTLPVGHRDLIYLLTQVSSAVARHPKIFLAAAKQILRADYVIGPNTNSPLTLDDSRLLVRSVLAGNRRHPAPQSNNTTLNRNHQTNIQTEAGKTAIQKTNNENETLKTQIPSSKTTSSTVSGNAAITFLQLSDIEVCRLVVKDLLRAIIQPCIHYGGVIDQDMDLFEEAPENDTVRNTMLNEGTTKPADGDGKKSTPNVGFTSNSATQQLQDKVEPCCCSWHIPTNTHWHKKPVLPRATLLKILADSVRSYQSLIPRIIIEHVYTPADSILIEKNQSFLSFILDQFLPIVRLQQDPEVSMMARVLIASLADCYGQNAVQTKVAEEIHSAIVRVIALPDSAEKHTRLQVIIGLLPTLIESSMSWSKVQLHRNHMYRILLRQGIMRDLTKIAQYKDLSNSNTLNTIYSILRPMEILLRLTVSPGPLSSKRFYFGTGPNGINTIVNRRFYPRFVTRGGSASFHANANTVGNANGNSGGGETVLRDIIRNVFADRRSHAFDIFLNADGLFVDSEETSPNNGTSGEDDAEEGEGLIRGNFTAGERNHLNLDRLWDDLMQSDGLRLVNRNNGTNNAPSNSSTSVASEHHRHTTNNPDSGNNDVSAGGGSDGASSSSETAAVVADNAASLMGEVSTSESDTESNASTENEHNDDDEEDEEDDVVVDGNDAGAEDHSETDADEETRQFIEVFERHIFEPESSETASNDADVDVDEDESDMAANEVANTDNNRHTLISDNVAATVLSGESAVASDNTPTSQSEPESTITNNGDETAQVSTAVTATNSESNNVLPGRLSPILNTVSTSSSGSVRTIPTFSWLTPRMSAFDGGDTNFRPSIEVFSASLIRERQANATVHGVPLNASTNAQPPVGTPAGISSGNTISSANVVGAIGLRRDQTRRLVFLDQQYCSPMPSFTSPTEEGQMELFNQDALHWWLEEAKHLDLESQTDACLYVAHLMVPHLIRELKTQSQKRTENSSTSNNISSAASNTACSNNRRSAIPVLIQSNSNQATANGNNVADNGELSALPTESVTDLSHVRVPQIDRLLENDMQPIQLNFLTEQDPDVNDELQTEAIMENEPHVDIDSEAQAEIDSHVDPDVDPSHVEVEDEDDDEADDDDEDEDDVFSDDVEEDGIGDDEDDDFYDDVEEEGMIEDEETELNTTFFEENEPLHSNIDWEQDEGALNRTFNMEFETDVIRNMSARPPPLINRPRPASAPASTMLARASSESNEAPVTSVNSSSNEPIPEVEEESQPSDVDVPAVNRTLVEEFESTSDEISQINRTEENRQNIEEARPEPTMAATELMSLIPASSESASNSVSSNIIAPSAGSSDAIRVGLATESVEQTAFATPNSFTFGANAAVANTEHVSAEASIGIVEGGAGGEPAAAIGATANVIEMSPEVRAALGDLEVPEGVDPSFLAALPSEMREEVIQEHLRMQRIRQRAEQNAIQVTHDALVEVNPEFLAALPPNIQSEVLMQQRIEQQRQAAQNSHPDDPVDTAAFFQNLPHTLRQAILTDMEESQIASLPPDLAAEAQYLRRDWETRNGARLDANSANTLSGYLSARIPSSLQNLNETARWPTNSIWYDANGTPQNHPQHHHATIVHHQQQHQMQGKPMAVMLMEEENIMLDPDSLATLLLFLFIEDSKMNYTRLHRVVRNLCYHVPTRQWVINALISIIKRTNESELNGIVRKRVKPQWLNLRIDAAFGYKSNVFIINKLKDSSAIGDNERTMSALNGEYSISVNPQAAQMVVRNCLDLLFVLAKNFPRSFVPYNNDKQTRSNNENISATPLLLPGVLLNANQNDTEMVDETRNPATRQRQLGVDVVENKLDDSPSTSKAAAVRNQSKSKNSNNLNPTKLPRHLQHYNTNDTSFWDVLLSIDNNTSQRMHNVQFFPLTSEPKWEWNNKQPDFLPFNDSPFVKLLEMLPYKVICRSPQLTDVLVKLLASLSNELPKEESIDVPPQPATTSTSNLPGSGTAAPNTNTGAKSKNDKADKDKEKEEEKTITGSISKRRMYAKNFSQLQLVIEVLTHQCGTVDGLDNVSKLIVNLSQCSPASNAIFLQYLRAATLGLAQEVREAIQSLLDEICAYNALYREKLSAASATTSNHQQPSSSSNSSLSVRHGIMQDRFTAENIVISASSTIKPTCELQLPAMKRLLSGSSSQPYFLRTLKIFMQIRELFETQENNSNIQHATPKPTLSQIICLDDLWDTLSACLVALEDSKDEYAVLVLQPTVEAFFLIHASYKKMPQKRETSSVSGLSNVRSTNASSVSAPTAEVNNSEQAVNLGSSRETAGDVANPSTIGIVVTSPQSITQKKSSTQSNSTATTLSSFDQQQQLLDRQKFLAFAEKHRTVLNQILRQSPTHLSDGPFAVLVDHTRILDFDVKRKYFQKELERIDEGVRREENTVGVRRVTVFEDSFRVLYRLGPEEWKNRFYIVFEDEEGQDAGGLLREWYVIISREIFNPMYALFCVSPGDRVTYMINPSSHANPNHLSYFKFVGRVIAKAIHDNKLLECYFTRSFYKHILGKQVKYTDMESQDYEFYKGLDYLMKNDISNLGYELTFSTEVQEFGVTQVRDLIPNGRDIVVTEENKFDYVQLVCQLKMSDSIRYQLDAFLEGFYDIIPKHLISIFNEQELELLISGLPDIDIEDLKANTEYHKYTSKSIQIQWFWRALRSFDQADRAKFLQFVTGTSKVPLQGFGSLEGMNGIQKFQIHRDDRSTDRLPCAHTCFNQLDLPMYKSYDKLRSCLSKAIHECSEGFGFA